MQKKNKIVYIVVGSTASGKSGLALDLAEYLNGVVINADSLQVYEALSLLTARPTPEDLKRTPHALYGVVQDPHETYSVARWHADALCEIEKAFKENKTPILVGGTGLYIKALLEGLNEVPEVEPLIRTQLRERSLLQGGIQTLYKDLQQQDSEGAARLKPNDTQRIIRALEVLLSTGKPLHEWQSKKSTPLAYEHKVIYINPSREEVVAHAKKRLEVMFEEGAIEEVKTLLDQGISSECSLRKAVGVREIEAYLSGVLTKEEAFEKSFIATRQYIKRQQTWFSRQLKTDRVIDRCYDSSLNLRMILERKE
ncbi:MAG TPA: tRNA (adenosine(37)-N6)-dimethylallyltransferase MiaA [Holosporales bacterium]|nr:tRNA (adenosine(37)-N6)-dimethylallyltransferase MiaA [Holosporales bacterium]